MIFILLIERLSKGTFYIYFFFLLPFLRRREFIRESHEIQTVQARHSVLPWRFCGRLEQWFPDGVWQVHLCPGSSFIALLLQYTTAQKNINC